MLENNTHAGEELVIGADYHLEPDPEPLLNLVGEILRWRLKARLLNLFKRNRVGGAVVRTAGARSSVHSPDEFVESGARLLELYLPTTAVGRCCSQNNPLLCE